MTPSFKTIVPPPRPRTLVTAQVKCEGCGRVMHVELNDGPLVHDAKVSVSGRVEPGHPMRQKFYREALESLAGTLGAMERHVCSAEIAGTKLVKA